LKVLFTPHVEHFTIGLTRELAKYIDVTLLSNTRFNTNVKQVVVPNLPMPMLNVFLKRSFCAIFPLFFDILHVNASLDGISMGKHEKLVVTEHCCPDPRFVHESQKKYYCRERDALLRLYEEGVPIITISNYCARMLRETYDIKVCKVIHNGLLDEFRTNEVRAPTQKHVILWSGRLNPIKEPYVFLEALANISSKINFKAVILGRGPLLGTMTKLVKKNKLIDKVAFVEQMPFKMLPTLYKTATLFVHTAVRDASPFTVLEAIGFGIPVIVPREGGSYEIAGSGALTFEPHDPIDLADKILSIVSDADMYRKQSKRSLERVRDFTWQKAAKEYLKIYQKLS